MRAIKLTIKVKVYAAVVLLTLLYACDRYAWQSEVSIGLFDCAVNIKKKKKYFHQGYLRNILRVKQQDTVKNVEVLLWAGMKSIHAMLCKSLLRWFGHIVRMTDECLPKKYSIVDLTWVGEIVVDIKTDTRTLESPYEELQH